jgi:hypothetical protein
MHNTRFSFRAVVVLVSMTAIPLVFACSSSSTTSPGTTKDGGGTTADGSASGGEDGSAGGGDSSAADDASSSSDAGGGVLIEVGDGGCVTYQTAQRLCGTMSDDSICKYSVTCGKSSDDSQCKINCEMASTVTCYTAADAKCLEDAVAAKSCTDIKACKWLL